MTAPLRFQLTEILREGPGGQALPGLGPSAPLHLKGATTHARRGATRNVFRYAVDYILTDAETALPGPRLYGRNRRAPVALHDRDHGGAPGAGAGASWVRQVLADRGLPQPLRIRLLAQPRVMGHVFNPVAFWLCDGPLGLNLVLAEVTNTYGDRHSYLCHHPDLAPILPTDVLTAQKVFHVSPFQDIAGDYAFRFDLRFARIAITIDHRAGENGLCATLTGPLVPLTDRGALGIALRGGSLRVLALIHWQALNLWRKGVAFRPRPTPPEKEVSS